MYCYGCKIIGKCLIRHEAHRYQQIIIGLTKSFLAIRDKSSLLKEFYRNRQSIFVQSSKFYLINIMRATV